MPAFLLKRLLVLIPTVWLIVTIMFLLSRFVPGSFLNLKLGSLNEQAQQQLNIVQQQQLLQQYKKQRGDDLPVFYFSIRSAAEPDTLWQVQPEQEQQVLRQWVLENGNWPAISRYYSEAKLLQQLLSKTTDTEAKANIAGLTSSANTEDLHFFYQFFKKRFKNDRQLLNQIIRTERALTAVHHSDAFNWSLYLPKFNWHGSGNQYHLWFADLLQGNLGNSYRDERPVTEVMAEAVAVTFLLMLLSLALILISSIEFGLLLARYRNTKFADMMLALLQVLDSVPVFLVALALLFLLSGNEWFPLFPLYGLGITNSTASFLEIFGAYMYYLTLPVLCLWLARLPYFTEHVYRATKQVLKQDFIVTARSKGLTEKVVLRKHAFRNGVLPLITSFTDFLPALLVGALVVEIVFAVPGLGRLLAESVLARDYPVVIGIVLLVAVFKVLSNLLADVLYYFSDPKIRYS